jgi:hypothetical protein
MKNFRRLILSIVVLASISPARSAEKTRTYALIGYFDGAKPRTETIAKACTEVATRMKDVAPVASEEDADQIVQVLFKRDGSYRIYWDALPLSRTSQLDSLDRYKDRANLAFEALMENSTGHGRANVR